MEKRLERQFFEEIEKQCDHALIAIDDMKRELTSDSTDNNRFWYSVQMLLITAANLSKIYWPIRKQYKSRGEHLRVLFSMSEVSPLSSRKFRDHLEHFDERIDTWYEETDGEMIVDSNIGIQSIEFTNATTAHYLRNFNTNDFIFTFRGDEFHLIALATEIRRIKQHCTETSLSIQQELWNGVF